MYLRNLEEYNYKTQLVITIKFIGHKFSLQRVTILKLAHIVTSRSTHMRL